MKKWNGLQVVIFGTSGISKETKILIDEINRNGNNRVFEIVGYVSEKEEEIGKEILGEKVVCSDESFEEFIKKYTLLGVVIPIGNSSIKRKIFERICKNDNLVYPNIISPSASLLDKETIKLGCGNIICSGCRLTTDIKIGDFNLINLNSTIGHDTHIGDFNVINPLASISGGVVIEDDVLIGASSSIKQGKRVGSNSVIGMGAIICSDVENDTVMICKKAQMMER